MEGGGLLSFVGNGAGGVVCIGAQVQVLYVRRWDIRGADSCWMEAFQRRNFR